MFILFGCFCLLTLNKFTKNNDNIKIVTIMMLVLMLPREMTLSHTKLHTGDLSRKQHKE